MNLKISENSQNYAATVIEIKEIFNIEGADKIKRTVVEGNSIVVGLDVQVGQHMIWFCAGTQLAPEFCRENDLYDQPLENDDVTKRGYISFKKRLVKAIKLRGIESNGMLLPLSCLKYLHETPESFLKLGDAFTELDENTICQKYVVPVRLQNSVSSGQKKQVNKVQEHLVDGQFKFHEETSHFAKNMHKFDWNTPIVITRKMHGSSGIVSHCLIKKDLTWKDKVAKFFKVKVEEKEYGFVWSSGKPKSKIPKGLISDSKNWKTSNQSYYTNDIWLKAYELLKDKTEKGISLYFEIVGQGIQGPSYTYNQEYGIYIYRITSTNPDGNTLEFSWNDIKVYCEKYGLQTVQEFYQGLFSTWGKAQKLVPSKFGSFDKVLEKLGEVYLNKSFPDCEVDEGICVRNELTKETFKLKSPKFLVKESADLELGVENIEEQ
jgi:hypothetical protein